MQRNSSIMKGATKTTCGILASPQKSEAKEDPVSSSSNSLEKLRKLVKDHVIEGGQSVSIELLTEVFGFDSEDSRLHNKVKRNF